MYNGRRYTFSDEAVRYFREFLHANKITFSDAAAQLNMLTSNFSRMCSPTKHPRNIQHNTYRLMCKLCPGMKAFLRRVPSQQRPAQQMFGVGMMPVDTSEIEDRIYSELLLEIYELEDSAEGIDHATLSAVARLIRMKRRGVQRADAGKQQASGEADIQDEQS